MPSSSSSHVVIFPFMAQGHALPLLDLSKALSHQQIKVTIITTPSNANSMAKYVTNHPDICWWEKPLVVALIPIVGDLCSPLRNGGVHDHCSKEAKHTDTIFNVVRLIAYIHGRDRYY
jgi:hypothetical protein